MKRRLLSLIGAIVILSGLAVLDAWSQVESISQVKSIFYEGMVYKLDEKSVLMDTAIFVGNPYTVPVPVMIEVWDKNGKFVCKKQLMDGGQERQKIPPMGYNWITLGMIVPPSADYQYSKYTYRIKWRDVPALAVEVKEVTYYQPVDPMLIQNSFYAPNIINKWSEAALGGEKATCVFGRGTMSIFYLGMLAKPPMDAELVLMDTGIFVGNPNLGTLTVKIQVFDKDGKQVYDGPLMDGTEPRTYIPPMGYNWITLGMIAPGYQYSKYTYRILWGERNLKPPAVEVKEVIYLQPVPPEIMIRPKVVDFIREWSEAALGGVSATCTY
ncbi:MAG: hypothetical protein AB1630_12020 [bacterium]